MDVTSDDSLTRIVNRDHTLSEDYVPADLRSVDVYKAKDVQLRDEAAASLEQMFAAAQADDVYLKLVDGYRSYKEQRSLYHTYLNANGSGYVNKIDDIPGASEHQLGLASDIGNYNGACELQTCFKDYSSYRWLSEHAADYGWIERFPQGRQSVTGVVYSPWHYRYVGVEEAKKIKASGLTMEEYYQLVPETGDGAN
ncbi:MAG TPA: D-alanyl-D-alanine carboxypeptidase [Erysipelotrichaceae bacterium]|nr:D-alanyl-D-alanine carboxypeptidase [Erysipelotrichaceae bacterium]